MSSKRYRRELLGLAAGLLGGLGGCTTATVTPTPTAPAPVGGTLKVLNRTNRDVCGVRVRQVTGVHQEFDLMELPGTPDRIGPGEVLSVAASDHSVVRADVPYEVTAEACTGGLERRLSRDFFFQRGATMTFSTWPGTPVSPSPTPSPGSPTERLEPTVTPPPPENYKLKVYNWSGEDICRIELHDGGTVVDVLSLSGTPNRLPAGGMVVIESANHAVLRNNVRYRVYLESCSGKRQKHMTFQFYPGATMGVHVWPTPTPTP